MQREKYRNTADKSKPPKLQLVQGRPAVKLGGSLPTEDMAPGKYHGVALRMWVDNAADAGGFVSPTGRYARTCEIALGRPLQESDPIDNPGEFFSGRRFIVFIGFRKSERAGGGGRFSDELAMLRKDRDYLRVHEIVSREDIA